MGIVAFGFSIPLGHEMAGRGLKVPHKAQVMFRP